MADPRVVNAVVNIDIPNFAESSRYDCGKAIIYNRKPDETFYDTFGIKIYPDGNCTGNKGYVSIFLYFDTIRNRYFPNTIAFAICVTVSVVDADGNKRYPQSFAEVANILLGFDDCFEPSFSDDKTYYFGLDRYMSRGSLLDSEVLMSDETMTIRFDITYIAFREPDGLRFQDIQSNRDIFHAKSLEEAWFVRRTDQEGNTQFSLRLDKKSALCSSFSRKSPVFRALLNSPMKECSTGKMDITCNYDTFFNMMCYVRYDTLNHVRGIAEVLDLYKLADMYDIPDLKGCCRNYCKYIKSPVNAINVVMIAHKYRDEDLKEIAMAHIKANLEAVISMKIMMSLKSDPELHDLMSDIYRGVSRLVFQRVQRDAVNQFAVSEKEEDADSKFDFYQ